MAVKGRDGYEGALRLSVKGLSEVDVVDAVGRDWPREKNPRATVEKVKRTIEWVGKSIF